VFVLLESLLLAQLDNDTRSITDAPKALSGRMPSVPILSTEPESQRVIRKIIVILSGNAEWLSSGLSIALPNSKNGLSLRRASRQ
jgi:hypothetical protein